MRVLLTGATGLLGFELLKLLLAGGHEVRCLVRPDSPNLSRLDGQGAEIFRGEASDEGNLRGALQNTDAFAHVAGLEHAPAARAWWSSAAPAPTPPTSSAPARSGAWKTSCAPAASTGR